MARPIVANVPHSLGKEEARRRLAEGFQQVQGQLAGGLMGMVAFTNRWDGDRLLFEGGGLGQRIRGRIDVLADSVHIEVDLPELLAALADRLKLGLEKQTQLLLGKK